MAIKKSLSRRIFEIFNNLFMIILVLVTLYPLLYVLFASFSDSDALTRLGGQMLWGPVDFTMEAYTKAFKNPNILTGYLNTLFLVFFGVIISLALSSIGAYQKRSKNKS